ncbi:MULTISPECIES: hypothetical protein [unclassified Bartonella]|uniref:hypothetical protein n=1 Tax=unclassified Bartonella TaxID=2645622 RepID=UPI0035D09E9E
MSNNVMFLLLPWFFCFFGFFCFFAVALIFIYKIAKRRSVTGWMFWRWVVLYGALATYLGFIYVGVGRRAVDGELLLKGAVFSCIFATVLGLVHLGVKSMPVAWQVFLKAVMFCCMMGFILWFAAVGVRDMDSIRAVFLKVLLLSVLLKVLLGFFIREQSDTVLQRLLRALNFVLFFCILAPILCFTRLGAENLGLSWLWFSDERVLPFIVGFFSPLIYQGVRRARVLGAWFLK